MPSSDEDHKLRAAAGLAHVATVSFLAARAAPGGGFWIALGGGVALARAAERLGARAGYGASLAAMLESVAVIGPARVSVPLTQAATAPLLGRLNARGAGAGAQILVCAAIRLFHNAATTAFFIWVIVGGVDAYAGTYDSLLGRLPLLPSGTRAALVLTAASLLAWAAFASTVQVLVYRRGLRRWPHAEAQELRCAQAEREPSPPGRFDPRAVVLAAAIAFALLLATTVWPLLAAVGAWLALTWMVSAGDRDVVPAGLAFTLVLAVSALAFGLAGGLGLNLSLRRATRAGLLVLVATWLRTAAGSVGLREVSRRALGRVRRVPSVGEATLVLDQLGSERALDSSARSLLGALGTARMRPLPLVDAVLGWVASESERFRAQPGEGPRRLAARARDGAVIALAAAPVLVWIGAG